MKELKMRRFEQSLDLLEKPSSDRAVGNAVIGGESRGHYRTHSNAFAVRHDAWTDLADSKNRTLRRINDGDEAIHTEHAEVRDRESTTFVVQRKKFSLLRLVRQLAALFAQL